MQAELDVRRLREENRELRLAAGPATLERTLTLTLGGLVLAPLNLVWLVQLVGLAAMTSCLTIGGDAMGHLCLVLTPDKRLSEL